MAVVMESNRDRPHSHPIRTLGSNTNEQQQQLFLCFTSRLSSSSASSMKISKSILSPGRDISLSSSLSRRLKTNGSLKGGQSPMFPTTTNTTRKKTGAGFENPEPSSPKVTCIGQVRVKSKKKKTNHHHHHHHSNNNNIRSRSQRRSGDYSFRRMDTSAADDYGNNGLKRQSSRNREIELESSQRHAHGHGPNNQKWVHIPVTICESLRSFGSDFNCFLPCRSSSSCREQLQQQREAEKRGSSSCGSVLARWLVAVQDGEGGEKGRQIELVVGGGDDDELCGRRSYRKRHVMEDIDIMEIEKDLREKVGGDVIVEGRVSICVPPKNALLLMRCGSDPVKMAALANRFWESREKEEEEEQMVKEEDSKECETKQAAIVFVPESDEQVTCDLNLPETDQESDENLCHKFVTDEDVIEENSSGVDAEQAVTGVQENDMEIIHIEHRLVVDEEAEIESGEEGMADTVLEEYSDTILMEQSKLDSIYVDCDDEDNTVEEKPETGTAEKESSVLPDCLLLMMCEPKLSMEVCQETWVCPTDFIRWLPPRELNKTTTRKNNEGGGAAAGDELSKRVSIHWKPPDAPENPQPRSSCSYPAPPAKQESACEPLYLTRCKSEPRRAAAKLAPAGPESCFWKNRPHAPVGVGAAGMGF